VPKHKNRLTAELILSLDPNVSRRTRLATAKDDPQGMERTLCPRRSSCLRLQLFSVEMCSFLLFQTIRVIAAIFRAKVRRVIEGLIPLVSKAW